MDARIQLTRLLNPDDCAERERTFEMAEHEWSEHERKNYYTIRILECGKIVGSFSSRTNMLTYYDTQRRLLKTSRSLFLRALRDMGVIPDKPNHEDWAVGQRNIPDAHPWRQRESRRYDPSTYRFRAKPLTRDRLDIRLRPETRDAINYYIATFGWTATQVIEHFIVSAYLRDAGKSMLPATDETPALPDGMHDF